MVSKGNAWDCWEVHSVWLLQAVCSLLLYYLAFCVRPTSWDHASSDMDTSWGLWGFQLCYNFGAGLSEQSRTKGKTQEEEVLLKDIFLIFTPLRHSGSTWICSMKETLPCARIVSPWQLRTPVLLLSLDMVVGAEFHLQFLFCKSKTLDALIKEERVKAQWWIYCRSGIRKSRFHLRPSIFRQEG